MIANILLAAYLLLMIYYWGMIQGAFSALIHLVVTIIAGALALALWQPLVLGFLIDRMPEYAWGVGLVGPFILLLIAIRATTDRLIRGNVIFSQWINGLAGGFMGLFAGILTSGLVIISLGFLPLGDSVLGYIPLSVADNGKVQKNAGALWVPVDRQAAGFFAMISGGSMAPGFPAANGVSLALNTGDLAQQSGLYHLREQYDPHTSVAAHPNEVSITQVLESNPASLGLGSTQMRAIDAGGVTGNRKLVIIDTKFVDDKRGTYIEGALNLLPTQVRLIAWKQVGGGNEAVLHAPVGVGIMQAGDSTRQFVPFNDNTSFARVTIPPANLALAFIIPDDQTPRFLTVRNLALDLPEAKPGADLMVAMLGKAPGASLLASAGDPNEGTVGPKQAGNVTIEAKGLKLTNELPEPFSENVKGNLRVINQQLVSGTQSVKRIPDVRMSKATRVDSLQVPPHLGCVRLQVAPDQAQSIFGRAISSARMIEPIFLTDDRTGEQHLPIGYIVRHEDGSMDISIDRDSYIRTARQMPIAQLQPTDDFYLYFMIPKGLKITSFHLGNGIKQDVNLEIPKN